MLCLWLPFTDGVIKNQGLINDEFITSIDPTFSNDGKLGKCLEQGQFDMSATMTSKILNNQALTICFWIYINAEEGSQGGTIFGNINTNVEFNNRKFSLFQYPTCNDLHLSWMNDTAKAFMMTPIYKGVLPSYQWTHVTITYYNPTMTVYINGIKKYTYSSVSNSSSFEYQTRVVWQNAYRKLNDFRIYNECLSPRQVKEISKGLVCHYPMGNVDGKIGGRNLLVKTNQGKTKWTNAHADGSYSCESVNWNGINAVKMSCATPTTSWKMFMFDGLLENFDKLEAGGNYILSYDVIGNIKVGFSNLWDSSAVNSIVEKSSITILETSYGYHYTVDILLKNILTKSKQVVYLHNNLKAGESVIIANLKLEKGNKATAYTPCPTDDPVMYDNVIYDTSGYGNNGSVSGDILWDTNTPRYKGAYDFNGPGYIYNDNLNLTTTAFTISFWIKIPSAITHQHFDLATFNSWTSEGIGIYWDTSGQKSSSGLIFGEDSNGDKIHVRVQCRGKLNEWTHFAITWDGTNVYRYSNGIKFSGSDFNAVSVYHPRLWLGNSTFGDRTLENSESCMSDFRFYVTALSDSDILVLYQSSASVDNNGNLMLAGEVIEE